MKLRDFPLLLPRLPAFGREQRLAATHSIEDLAREARRRLPSAPMAYLDGGAEDEITLRRNRAAFDDIALLPRVLRDVSSVDLSTTVLGRRQPTPLVFAPVGAPAFLHHEGERAVARAAASARVPYAISTVGSTSIDDVASEGDAELWLQLYLWGDRGEVHDLIDRAQDLGYRALVLTSDVSVRSKRERELRAGLRLPAPTPSLSTVLDGLRHPAWTWRFLSNPLPSFPNVHRGSPATRDLGGLFDGTGSWDDVRWLRDRWDGPLVVKGIITAEDASRAADAGVDGVVVSNHGGRQLDHLPATIEVLPEVVAAVGDHIEVLFDSGIRRGSDILKALALGARAVLVGRAHLYGLAAGGEAGVTRAVDILLDEIRRAMALSGVTTVDELHGSGVTSR